MLLAEELVQLLGGSAGDDRGDDASHAAPRQHPRQQPPRVQRPGDAHVERPQRPSARQEQRGPPEAVPRLLQERQLLLDGHVVVLRDGPQLRASLVDVVSHRPRHPPQRLVQLAPDVRHVSEVPQDVRAEAEHHLLDVTGRALRAKQPELLLDELAIVRSSAVAHGLTHAPHAARGVVVVVGIVVLIGPRRRPRRLRRPGPRGWGWRLTVREGPEPPRVFLLECLHAVREADEFLVRRRVVERRLDLRGPLPVLPEQRPPVAVATAMDEVQGEDGEEVAGGAVGRRASHLRRASRRGCSDLGGSRAAAGEERARASVGVEEDAKGERALRGGEGVVPVRSRGVARVGRRRRGVHFRRESRRRSRQPLGHRAHAVGDERDPHLAGNPTPGRAMRSHRRRRGGVASVMRRSSGE